MTTDNATHTKTSHMAEPQGASPVPQIEVIGWVPTPPLPENSQAMTLLVVLPPGSAGTPPHRHTGPAFGYVIEGEMIFELEGEPPRVVRAGETFSEPGGTPIHYRDGNNLAEAETRFVVTMFGDPNQPMQLPVSDEDLEEHESTRARQLMAVGDRP